MSWYTYNQAGVLIEKGDDTTSTVTDYDSTGVQVSTRPYTATEVAQAQATATAATASTNLTTLQQRAQTALTNNQNYLANPSPTSAQAIQQVGALTRQVNALIRITIQQLSTITDS